MQRRSSVIHSGGTSEYILPYEISDFLTNASFQPEKAEYTELKNIDNEIHVERFDTKFGKKYGTKLNR